MRETRGCNDDEDDVYLNCSLGVAKLISIRCVGLVKIRCILVGTFYILVILSYIYLVSIFLNDGVDT